MSMRDYVPREDHGHTALLYLNRPEKRNALSLELLIRLKQRLDEVEQDDHVRVVVLTGMGQAFCTGMDLREAGDEGALREDDAIARARDRLERIAESIERLHRSSRPTVAAVNGDAVAGGAGLALACDVVIAADTARFGYPEAKRGLVASIVLPDLVRTVGERRARRLLLVGDLIPAEQALDWGLATEVVAREACVTVALCVARRIAECGPQALKTLKTLLDQATGRPLDPAAAINASLQARTSDEGREGVQAFLEKRLPRWAPG